MMKQDLPELPMEQDLPLEQSKLVHDGIVFMGECAHHNHHLTPTFDESKLQ